MKFLCLLWVLCASVVNCFALDREAFTFTQYDLKVQVEPEQQRLAVRGKITLRNDSASPQRNAVLQISSTLDWRSIEAEGKPLQFVSQPYTSDVDHTGQLSEAIVTLPREVPPKATIELEIGYEGTVPLNVARLTRIGAPEEVARHTDWDQVSQPFTAVRGIGYVAWYPVAMESASLSEGNSLFEAQGRWKARHAVSNLRVDLTVVRANTNAATTVLFNSTKCSPATAEGESGTMMTAQCSYEPLGLGVPAFVIANYSTLERPAVRVYYLAGHNAAAADYVMAAEKVLPFITEWFGAPRERGEIVELADAEAAPFESGSMLLTPLKSGAPRLAQITLAHELTHAAFAAPRPWIYEGLAHFSQALYRERERGRLAALDLMGLHRAAVMDAEKAIASHKPDDAAAQSLIMTTSEEFYRSKAMYVWWMLRDMVGGDALKKALAAYRPEQDKEPSYVQHLIEAQTKRDLEWFFDDWVYRDRGLPDFRVESAYPRPTVGGGYVVTVTVENLGSAGAEVPLTVRGEGGEVSKRLEVHGKAKGVIRVEVPSAPQEVVVNDGSVPESDMRNNVFRIETDK